MIKKLSYDLVIKLVSVSLVLYLLIIIVFTIISQEELINSQKNELNLQIDNNLITLSSFIKFEEESINLLSQDKHVLSYFLNKALGMSLQYGLKANIIKIDKTIDKFIEDKNKIFDAIVVLDQNFHFISKMNININSSLIEKIKKSKSYLISEINNNILEVFVYKEIKINDNTTGYIVAKINFNYLINRLLSYLKNNYQIYLTYENKVFDSDTLTFLSDVTLSLDKQLNKNSKFFIKKTILDSNISVLINTNQREQYLTSKSFIILLIILSILVFYGIYFTFSLNRKNIKLNSRMQDAKKINEFLEEKVNLKTLELQKLNNQLKERVQDEINKNKNTQRMLYNQSKMALMGQMLDNIAHQWRQPLSAISSSASFVKVEKLIDTLDDKTLIKNLDRIIDSTVFLSETIEDFRGFFKLDKTKKKFNVKDTYIKTKKLMISVRKKSDVQVVENLNDVQIKGYPNELVQVLLNIINNAYDAFISKEIETKKFIFVDIYENESFIVIKIKDNAGGIPNNIIHKVFDAHFTTKDDLTGTGIGLFMTKEIVEKHMKGTIQVSNKKFDFEKNDYFGAEFILSFPKENK